MLHFTLSSNLIFCLLAYCPTQTWAHKSNQFLNGCSGSGLINQQNHKKVSIFKDQCYAARCPYEICDQSFPMLRAVLFYDTHFINVPNVFCCGDLATNCTVAWQFELSLVIYIFESVFICCDFIRSRHKNMIYCRTSQHDNNNKILCSTVSKFLIMFQRTDNVFSSGEMATRTGEQ